ncbi:LptE family protein [Flagellimonas sp.]|uniref:LptE family protein n=1 Tax=Flagellimonas sp. TaxID=2058762 RepID=UPI003B5A9C60
MIFLKKYILSITLIFILLINFGCGPKLNYDFRGINTSAESFEVNFFKNHADQNAGSIIHPGLDRDFTQALQNSIGHSTKLTLTNNGGELIYEGEIVEYRVTPMTATADQLTAQNRLTMSVNVRFFNKTKEDADFERRFSFFFDFDAAAALTSVQAQAHEEIFERLTQDIFNASLGNW